MDLSASITVLSDDQRTLFNDKISEKLAELLGQQGESNDMLLEYIMVRLALAY